MTAVLVAAGAVAAVLLAGHQRHPGVPAAAGRTASPSPSAPATAPVPQAPQIPHVDLSGLTWASYHGVSLPHSAAAGPRRTGGGLASGYSDTPLGALMAAVNIGVRSNGQWGPAVFGPTIRDQVTGPDAAALLAACQATYEQGARAAHVTGGKPLGNAYVTEEAFRWEAWTPASATLDVVSAGPGSQGVTVRAATRIELVWSAGDWRVVAPPGGDWGAEATQLTSLAGYTLFPGQEG